ncbi:PEP-CTERM sorting domain-containing protein [Cerasicoccus arenae]|uniref:PEP-CTERM protein-sorting domain-containing protein n=1 Tax=Cerasicoccus arenae TaxID=424488 RepID=A0A8J3DCM4_9BACT|nr:PEP-CTERM sorting domain-containing protein [Cerasicoccus arenae]MBK1859071.1 PEP-CTERM sorting domain-containing protein [Cerasicoccus arenae]GHC03491.1 hypothetical protein GCM10007047_20110 [Cerasicoccus arenae]
MKIPVLTAAAILAGSLSTQAATISWDGGGGDNLWFTPTNWDTDTVPVLNGTDDAVLNASAQYDPGGDFVLQGGSTLTVQNGGHWEQINGVAWIQGVGGNLVVEAGGIFDTGTAGNMIRDAGTSISVGGTFSYNAGNFIYDPVNFGSFALSSGANLNVSGEFQPLTAFSFNSGVSFVGGSVMATTINTTIVTVDGASVSLVDNGPSIAGLFGFDGTNGYVDFTSNGGSISLSDVDSPTEVETAINTGLYRYEGAIDPTNITFIDLGGGDYQINAATVPEPSAYAMLTGLIILGVLITRQRRR